MLNPNGTDHFFIFFHFPKNITHVAQVSFVCLPQKIQSKLHATRFIVLKGF